MKNRYVVICKYDHMHNQSYYLQEIKDGAVQYSTELTQAKTYNWFLQALWVSNKCSQTGVVSSIRDEILRRPRRLYDK